MPLPPNFGVFGCSEDLAAEIDDDFSHFFPAIATKSSASDNGTSVTDGECCDDDHDGDIGSDIEDDDGLSGSVGIMRSPIIQSRIRLFIRGESNDIAENEYDNDMSADEDDSSTCKLTAHTHRQCRKKCLDHFKVEDILENRLNVQEMDKDVKDMLIMGQLQACGTVKGTDARDTVKRHRYDYQFQNTAVCKSCFLYINNINGHYLKNVRTHFLKNGAVPRVHGNTGRKPKNAVKYEHVQQVVQFISRYVYSCKFYIFNSEY